MVVCLLLRNAHKMTRQAALNGCSEYFLKSKQTTYNTTTLGIDVPVPDQFIVADYPNNRF